MNKKNSWLWGLGLVVGMGAVAVYLSKKNECLSSEKDNKENVPARKKAKKVVPKSAKEIRTTTKSLRRASSGRRQSKLVKEKLKKSDELLKKLRRGREYTQVEIQELSKIPYRSVRRYVDELLTQGKLEANGYGKGKRFKKV